MECFKNTQEIKDKLVEQVDADVKSVLIKIFGEGLLTEEELEEVNKNNMQYVMTLYKLHENRKKALGHRVQVLRVLVRRLYEHKRLSMNEFEFNVRVEKYLDNFLVKYEYNLERAIRVLRSKGST